MNFNILIKALLKLKNLRKRDKWQRESIISYREEKLKGLREYAYKNSPFYQEFHKGFYDAPLSQLPVLTKSSMMQNFDRLVTDPVLRLSEIREFIVDNKEKLNYKSKYWINTTSGSTGNPGIFIFNNDEWASVMASFSRMQELSEFRINIFNPPRRALVSSHKITHMSALVAKTIGKFFMPMLHLDASEDLKDIIRKLNDFQPQNLVGYASMIHILAHEQLKGNLKISPEIVFSSSEVLTEEKRNVIEKAFGKVLFNEYASTETGSIAGECTFHSGLHLIDDEIYVEVVDKNNNPVQDGTFGDKLLVSILFNKTQPLIRYELTDSIKMATKNCACGRPFLLIDEIQGRAEDILYFTSTAGKEISIHPNKIDSLMESLPVTSWQIVLENKQLRVSLVGKDPEYTSENLGNKFNDFFSKEAINDITIVVNEVAEIPKSASGKAPLIKNLNLKK